MTLLALIKLLPSQTDHRLSTTVFIFQFLDFYFTIIVKVLLEQVFGQIGICNSSLPNNWRTSF